MHNSRRDRATGPNAPEDQSGPDHDGESEPRAAPDGRPDHDVTSAVHPVDRVYGLLRNGAGTDEYLEKIRGRR